MPRICAYLLSLAAEHVNFRQTVLNGSGKALEPIQTEQHILQSAMQKIGKATKARTYFLPMERFPVAFVFVQALPEWQRNEAVVVYFNDFEDIHTGTMRETKHESMARFGLWLVPEPA